MDTKTKIFWACLVLLVFVSVCLSYQRTVVNRDFEMFDSESGLSG